ncbi:3-hydroxyacyl- dehydrogenase [Lasiodiplodia theobromae]|uniref:3-hydroxyacyl- dehydrogenase n=1 Tax=Lasiodiplodia theobromae TaxID=45133 RepID=UPI0015C3664E|nr:3-hydroxyacyl- dehydrogenase [Lasiodiplodia theobromae]KAF4539942.1 3-hydroxyacyl- dehydrogenase [Lasiodiplodia theobromae]
MPEASEIKKVAIIGCGAIGASWAALFAGHGLQVSAFDIKAEAETFVRELVASAVPTLSRLGQLKNDTDDASTVLSRIHFTTSLATALRDADFVQENGPERLDFKQQLFRDIASHIRPDVVIATSSSGLTCSSIQAGLTDASTYHPERCVVGHPFNPPHLIPLVEVVGGAQTSAETVERAMAFYAALGKKAVHVKREVPGHIANRLQAALVREILHLTQEGVCSVQDIDDAVAYGPGLRWGVMGPSALLHLGGGPGGIEHLSQHLLKPLTGWWAPSDPVVDEKLRKKWVDGTMEAVDGRSYEDLSRQRDEEIVELLRTRKEWDGYAEAKKGEMSG